MRTLLSLSIGVLLAFGLSACASKQSRWQIAYEAAPNAPVVSEAPKTRFQWANYDPLAEGKILSGYTLLGTTRFRDEPLDEAEFVPGSSLETFAKSIGADTVLLGRKPAGTEMRVKYIRTVSPGVGGDPGDPTAGGRTVESVPYETPVPVMDYIAVFLRLAGPSAD